MRISLVTLANYRQYRDARLELPAGDGSDLHILVGQNGAGKTNLLNGISWCLYGDEPHLSLKSRGLGRANLAAIEEAGDGGAVKVEVQVVAEIATGLRLTFQRTERYRVRLREGERGRTAGPSLACESSRFTVYRLGEDENTKVLEDPEECRAEVDRFVPQSIREFFFFDGERLDTYFREATAQNIRHAIFHLSRIDLLQRIEEHLDATLNDLRRESRRYGPALEQGETELADAQAQQAELARRIIQCEAEITAAKEKCRSYQDKLRGLEETEGLEKRREELRDAIKNKTRAGARKASEKSNLLYDYGKLIGFLDAAGELVEAIRAKVRSREIPPAVGRTTLQDSLKDASCRVCGRSLDDAGRKHVEELLREITVSSESAALALRMESYLSRALEDAKGFKAAIGKTTQELHEYEQDLMKLEKELADIDARLIGYNVEEIGDWSQNRKKYERLHEELLERLGQLKQQKSVADARLEKAQKKYDEELTRSDRAREVALQVHFCEKSLSVARQAKHLRMDEARREIEDETTRRFMQLVWKKNTFEAVRIGEDYDLSLMHVKGYECLGSVSAAERQLLAFSFTLALHSLSGFDAPILIDTPVARVTGENRANFARVLTDIASRKQTVLLLTPDEYSESVSSCLAPASRTRYDVRLNQSETEATMENLSDEQ